MNSTQRFSPRHLGSALLISLFVGISLTPKVSANPTSKKTVAKPNAPQKPAKQENSKPGRITGAFGLKLGAVFTPRKGEKPLSPNKNNVASDAMYDIRREYGNSQFLKQITPEVYKVTPKKSMKIFQSYYVCILPKSHKIYKIVAIDMAANKQEVKRDYWVLLKILKEKYQGTSAGGSSEILTINWNGDLTLQISQEYGRGENLVKLYYCDNSLIENIIQAEKAKAFKKVSSRIDRSAL